MVRWIRDGQLRRCAVVSNKVKLAVIGGILALIVGLPVGVAVGIMSFVSSDAGSSSMANPCTPQGQYVNPGAVAVKGGIVTIDGVKLDPTQMANASLIAKIGQLRGFSRRDIAIAIATSYQEAELYNLDHGDRDSKGLFQQRPSQGWGTISQIMDPVYATNTFYDHLAKVKDRGPPRSMMEVAKDVQRPDPVAYANRWRWDRLGLTLAALFAKDAPDASASVDYSVGCQASGSGVISATGWTLPLKTSFVVTSNFSAARLHPKEGIVKPHSGIDLGVPYGTPVYAANSGTVLMAQIDGTHGKYVLLQHSGGTQTGYAHLRDYAPGVVFGARVTSGQLIGYVGMTGSTTGPHLHFETMIGKERVNPVPFMKQAGAPL